MLAALDLVDMEAALRSAERGAEEARALAPGPLDRAFAWVTGAESTVAAVDSNADAAARLVDSLRGRLARLKQDPGATDADVADFIAACGVARDNRESAAAAELVKPETAAVEVAAETASDIASGVKWTAAIVGPLLILAAVVYLAVLKGRR